MYVGLQVSYGPIQALTLFHVSFISESRQLHWLEHSICETKSTYGNLGSQLKHPHKIKTSIGILRRGGKYIYLTYRKSWELTGTELQCVIYF